MAAEFHVLHAEVTGDSENTQLYKEVMSDCHIHKTGRYVIVREPKFHLDPTTGSMTVLVEYIDHGIMSEKTVNKY